MFSKGVMNISATTSRCQTLYTSKSDPFMPDCTVLGQGMMLKIFKHGCGMETVQSELRRS